MLSRNHTISFKRGSHIESPFPGSIPSCAWPPLRDTSDFIPQSPWPPERNHRALKVFCHEAQTMRTSMRTSPSSLLFPEEEQHSQKAQIFSSLGKSISCYWCHFPASSVLGTQTWQTVQSKHSSKHSYLLLKFSVLELSKTVFLTFTRAYPTILSSVKNIFFIDIDLVFLMVIECNINKYDRVVASLRLHLRENGKV